MDRYIRMLLIVLSLLFAVPHLSAQEGISKKKQDKIQRDKAKQEKKDLKKKEKADRKRHLGIQDKDTRKRIKRHTKRANKHGSRKHRDGFFRRLFTK